MAAAQNRNKLVITSLLEPTRGCAGDGPRLLCCVGSTQRIACISSPGKAGGCLEVTSFLQAGISGFICDVEEVSRQVAMCRGSFHCRSSTAGFVSKLGFTDVRAEGEGAAYLSRNGMEELPSALLVFWVAWMPAGSPRLVRKQSRGNTRAVQGQPAGSKWSSVHLTTVCGVERCCACYLVFWCKVGIQLMSPVPPPLHPVQSHCVPRQGSNNGLFVRLSTLF